MACGLRWILRFDISRVFCSRVAYQLCVIFQVLISRTRLITYLSHTHRQTGDCHWRHLPALCDPLIPPRQHDNLGVHVESLLPLIGKRLTLFSRCRRCLIVHVGGLFGHAYADFLGHIILHGHILRRILQKRPFAFGEVALETPHFAHGEVSGQLTGKGVGCEEQRFALVSDPELRVCRVTVVSIVHEATDRRWISVCRGRANPENDAGTRVGGIESVW